MAKRRKNIVLKKSSAKKTSFLDSFMKYSFLAGLILLVFEISIYRSTIISVYIPLSIIIGIGLLLHILTFRKIKYLYPETKHYQYFTYCLFSGGAFACYLFMAANYYILDSDIKYYSFTIKEKSSMPGGKGHRDERQPLVRVDWMETEKEFVFAYSDRFKVEQAKSIIISVRKGLFGYDVVCSRNLL